LARRGMSPQRLVRHRRLGVARSDWVACGIAGSAWYGVARLGSVRHRRRG
jgi:hypothetical protein